MRARVTDYVLYRWRYPIGYVALLFVVIAACLIAFHTPSELRIDELSSSIASGSLSKDIMSPTTVVNLPYHVLQRASFALLGVTTFSIKLPSLILGIATSIGVFFLIRTWFRRNVAIMITALVSSTTQFLFIIQDGTPKIMFVAVAVWLLVASTHVTRNKAFGTFWKVLTGVLIAIALYMPLGVYLVAAVLTTAFFHPHIRYVMKHVPRLKLILALMFGAASVIPLVYASIIDIKVLTMLVGIPVTGIDWLSNAKTLFFDIFGFTSQSSGYMPRPLYSLGIVLLMAIGAYKVFRVRHTARSYIVLILGIIIIPFVLMNPDLSSNFYVIAIILIAYGLDDLIVTWYTLFPRNPYARIGGLIPLGVLVVGIMFSGVLRYTNNFTYTPGVLAHYSSDLTTIERTVASQKAKPVTLLTSNSEFAFYALVARYDQRIVVTTSTIGKTTELLVTKEGQNNIPKTGWDIVHIDTSSRKDASDRVYIYKPATK